MATLMSQAESVVFNQKYSDIDYFLGKNRELWIYPLDYQVDNPPEKTLTISADVAEDGTSVTLAAPTGETLILYKKQVIFCPTADVLLVVATDTTITDAGVAVPILAAEGAVVALNNEPIVYPMIPVLSVETGGIPNMSAQEATANNKGQGIFNAKAKVTADSQIQFTGTVNRNDPALTIIENGAYTTQRFYLETRLPAFDNRGEGYGAKKFRGYITNWDPSSDRGDFEKLSFTVSITGCPESYVLLGS